MTLRADCPQLRTADLVRAYGFTARHWARLATAGRIPGARQPWGPKGHWVFDAKNFASYAQANGLSARKPAPRQRKPLRQPRPEDVVYIIYSAGHIKIGVSSNVVRRSHSFTTASPAPLRLLAKIKGSNDLEVDIHRRFNGARHKGEWFRLTPEIRAFVLQCQSDGEHCSDLEIAEAEFRTWIAELVP